MRTVPSPWSGALLALTTGALLAACSPSVAAPAAPNGTIASTAAPSTSSVPMTLAPAGFWDTWGDGRGELAGYALTQPRYGELRRGEAVLVTVTETFTAGQRVKSDGGHPDEYPVLKLNEVRDFQTGIYDYNVMTSSWLRLDGEVPLGLPDKVSFSMQEWCGHVYEEMTVEPGGLARGLASYFDGESAARSEQPIPPGGVVADAMPMLVRGLGGPLLPPGASREVPWLPSASERRMLHQPFGWIQATLTRSAATQTVTVPAGSYEAYTVTATPSRGASTTWYVDAASSALVKWTRSDGEVGALTGVARRTYWSEHGEGAQSLRSTLGLPARGWP